MAAKSKWCDPTEYTVPRNFKLLDELESAEKGKYSDIQQYGQDCNFCNIGLEGMDPTFTNWNASGGHIGDRVYSLKIECGPGYPNDPPKIRFVNKVSIPCVDRNGNVNFKLLKGYEWHRESYLFEAVLAIRKQMKPSPVAQACAQIPQGTTY